MNNRELYVFQRLMGVKLLPYQVRLLEALERGNRLAFTDSRRHSKRYIEELWKEYRRLIDGFV